MTRDSYQYHIFTVSSGAALPNDSREGSARLRNSAGGSSISTVLGLVRGRHQIFDQKEFQSDTARGIFLLIPFDCASVVSVYVGATDNLETLDSGAEAWGAGHGTQEGLVKSREQV